MWTKPYGRTGKDVSVIGFGGMRFANPEDIDANAQIVRYGFDKGINYFDTAPGYCNDKSEEILGAAIKDMPRNEFYISTKTFESEPAKVREAIEKSLKRLNVDCIDFYHMWCLTKSGEFETRRDAGGLEAMLKAREEGLIKHVVCSSHLQGDLLREVLEIAPFEGVLMGYCAINFPYRDAAVDAARKLQLGVVTMNPLGGGLIPEHAEQLGFIKGNDDESVVEAALRFNISNPGITCALVGFTTTEQIDQAVTAVENFTPYPEAHIESLRENILDAFDGLCTGCGYCMPCPNGVNIPQMMDAYNMKALTGKDKPVIGRLKWHWQIDPADASKCTACGACEDKCTQHLPISDRLQEIAEIAGDQEEKK